MAKGDSMVTDAIERALALRDEKTDLLKRIGDNRQLLRLLDSNDSLSSEESAWLAEFYPVKVYSRSEAEEDEVEAEV